MENFLTRSYTVASRESDMHRMCRPSALLGFLQDLATEHAEILGIGREVLLSAHGAFWMLVRLSYKLNRPILAYETLRITTWPRYTKGVTVYRDFDIFVGEEKVGEAVTAWVVADYEKRRILRPDSIVNMQEYGVKNPPRDERLDKLKMPPDLQPAGTCQVRYSETDINGHMNNVRYADVACDALGFGQKTDAYISAMQICYEAECFAGETLRVLKAEENGLCYVEGTDENGKTRFDVAVTFSKKTDKV